MGRRAEFFIFAGREFRRVRAAADITYVDGALFCTRTIGACVRIITVSAGFALRNGKIMWAIMAELRAKAGA